MLKQSAEQKQVGKKTYRAKEGLLCPICRTEHFHEELLSGGGRLIAGEVTKGLRRQYVPSKKYGITIPLVYTLVVCPSCLFTAYPKDFQTCDANAIPKLKSNEQSRKKLLEILFGKVDFNKDRDIISGVASYILSVDCYHVRDKMNAPTFKKALSSLRAAWLLDDLFKQVDYRPYDVVRDFYFLEATSLYQKSLEYMQTGEEPVDSMSYMVGPDLDHNWGYDGVLYLNAYFAYSFWSKISKDKSEQLMLLQQSQRYLSKIYGLGKASLAKPALIVNYSKDLFDKIGQLIEKIQTSDNADK